MAKYLIQFNYGYGEETEVVEEDTLADAERYAYEQWREGAEMNADHSAKELTCEEARDYGYEDELEGCEEEN